MTEPLHPFFTKRGFHPTDHVSYNTKRVDGAFISHVVTVAEASALLSEDDGSQSVWIGAQPVKVSATGRGASTDVVALRTVYADLDDKAFEDGREGANKAVVALSDILGQKPAALVVSGHGLQPHWKVAPGPFSTEAAAAVLNDFGHLVKTIAPGVDSVFDLARILRAPDTVNHKAGMEPVRTSATYYASEPLTWDQIRTTAEAYVPQAVRETGSSTSVAAYEGDDKADTPWGTSAVQGEIARLDRMVELRASDMDRYKGDPWNATCFAVACRLIELANGPTVALTVEQAQALYLEHAPSDAGFSPLGPWTSALKKVGTGAEMGPPPADESWWDEVPVRQVPSIQERFSDGPVPDHARPLKPFKDPDDWDSVLVFMEMEKAEDGPMKPVWTSGTGKPLTASTSVENRVEPLVAQATAAHGREEHDTGSHPWCLACEMRALGKDNLERNEKRLVEARCRGYLVRQGGRLPEVLPLEPSHEGPTILSFRDLAALPAPSWWLRGAVPAGSYGIVRGRDNAGKSLVVQDMVLEVLTGSFRNWEGGSSAPADAVLYCQGEGVRGIGPRVDAWLGQHGDVTFEDLDGFAIVPGCPNLYEPDDLYDKVLAQVRETKPSLIVIDTLNRAVAGADQNSAGDASIVRANVQRLQRAAGPDCSVIVVGHTAKNDSDLRGSSAFEDDSDFVLAVSKPDDSSVVSVKVTKQRDAGTGHTFTLEMKVDVDHDTVYLTGADQEDIVVAKDNTVKGKVLGVLWNEKGLDPIPRSKIEAEIRKTLHGEEMPQIGYALSRLVKDGQVIKHDTGSKAAVYSFNTEGYSAEHLAAPVPPKR